MTQSYFLEIDGESVNDAYITRVVGKFRTYRFLNPQHLQYKEVIQELMALIDLDRGKFTTTKTFISVSIVLVLAKEDFFFKNGEVKPKDASNHTKLVEDSISEYIQIDDKYNIDCLSYKRCGKYNCIIIKVTDEHSDDFDNIEQFFE